AEVSPCTAGIRICAPRMERDELEGTCGGRPDPFDLGDHRAAYGIGREPIERGGRVARDPARDARDLGRVRAVARGGDHAGSGVREQARGVAVSLPEFGLRREVYL